MPIPGPFVVEGAGTPGVDGLYSRTLQQCDGAEAFRQVGTSLVLIRRGHDAWAIADLRGSSTCRWSLRAVELYRSVLIPAGSLPPPLGWEEVDGLGPAPVVMSAKSMLPLEKEAQEAWATGQLAGSKGGGSLTKSLGRVLSEPDFHQFSMSRTRLKGSFSVAAVGGKSPTMAQTGTLPSLSGAAKVPLKGALARQGKPPGSLGQFACCFRVVLSRPSARTPWGCVWSEPHYRETGSRFLHSVAPGSPLERWNMWQDIRGRPGICVIEGDRLLRVDGQWAYQESEVGTQDSDHSNEINSGDDPNAEAQSIVLEFARPVARPAMMAAPRLETWEVRQTLVVQWKPLEYEKVYGYAICLQEIESGVWYAIDGATRAARPLCTAHCSIGAVNPESTSVLVSEGVAQGKAFIACISVLTGQGWSAFSEISRSVSMASNAQLAESIYMYGVDRDVEDWKGRPRYAVPSELLPGASAPIEIVPGPTGFLEVPRRLKFRPVFRGSLDGLHVRPSPGGAILLVEHVRPGSPVDAWNMAQEEEFGVKVHGAMLSPALQTGDAILTVNGVKGAKDMLIELERQPETFVFTVERAAGGGGAFEGTFNHDEGEDALFTIDTRLDRHAVQFAEDMSYQVYLTGEEAVLASRLVERDIPKLEAALDVTRKISKEPLGVRWTFDGILATAEARLLLYRGCPALVELARPESPPKPVKPHKSFAVTVPLPLDEDGKPEDEASFFWLRREMADSQMDDHRLAVEIKRFGRAPKNVRTSQSAQTLLARAKALQALWRFRRRCARAKEDLTRCLAAALARERDVMSGAIDPDDEAPLNLDPLKTATEEAAAYRSEMETDYVEAREVLKRMLTENERAMALKHMRDAAVDPKADEAALTAAVDAAEAVGVEAVYIEEGRRRVEAWKEARFKKQNHDELYAAVLALDVHVQDRSEPAAGTEEQRRVRKAIVGSGLPQSDPLVVKAVSVLKAWEQDNFALQAEARLLKAEHRCDRGFVPGETNSGELLSSAIADVSQRGVAVKYLEHARETLARWLASRLKRARHNLDTAMHLKVEDRLKLAIEEAEDAEVEEDLLISARNLLKRLQAEDEVNRLLTAVFETPDLDKLESAIQKGHAARMCEEDSWMLLAGTMQFKLQLWTHELQDVFRSRVSEGLAEDLKKATAVLGKARHAMDVLHTKGTADVAKRTLARDMRKLELMIPKAQEVAAEHDAKEELLRVMGALERHAAELPTVLQCARDHGLGEMQEVEQGEEAWSRYQYLVGELRDLVSQKEPEISFFIETLKLARIAGAPMDLVERAFSVLELHSPSLFAKTEAEIDVLVAIQEADDVSVYSVEHRFLRVQDTLDKAKKMRLTLDNEVEDSIYMTNIALAAEQTLHETVAKAQKLLGGDPPAEIRDLERCDEQLATNITACSKNAAEDVKAQLPAAEELRERLKEEADFRKAALSTLEGLSSSTSLKEVWLVLKTCREACLPAHLLASAYAMLRRRKLDLLAEDFDKARAMGLHGLALAFWRRGEALGMAGERGGEEWQTNHEDHLLKKWNLGVEVRGEISIARGRCGGSFGTPTWRQNPYFTIRHVPNDGTEQPGASREYSRPSSSAPTRVTVYLVEGGSSPATLRVHVVRNRRVNADTASGPFLAPGFEVIACSAEGDEVPSCSFDFPFTQDDWPVLIVPSASRAEEGPFTLLVQATTPVVVEGVPEAVRNPWKFEETREFQWAASRPYNMTMGGSWSGSAPALSWYRNPQFRICLKDSREQVDSQKKEVSFETPPSDEAAADVVTKVFSQCAVGGRARIGELRKAAKRSPFFLRWLPLPQEEMHAMEMERDIERTLFMAQGGPVPAWMAEMVDALFDGDAAEEVLLEDLIEDLADRLCEPSKPLLLALVSPSDVRKAPDAPKPPASAVHIFRNLPRDAEEETAEPSDKSKRSSSQEFLDAFQTRSSKNDIIVEQDILAENPRNYEVLGSSGASAAAYVAEGEVGALSRIGWGESVFVVPSLVSKTSTGKYTLNLYCSQNFVVERVN